MIEIERVTKTFGKTTALSNVSLSVKPGTICGLVGHNGAGKSTLIKIAVGLMSTSAGAVRICGHDMSMTPVLAKALIGYVPDQPMFYEGLTLDEFLLIAGSLHGMKPSAARASTRTLVSSLGLEPFQTTALSNLSKGLRQKVALASALVHGPQVLVCDEPFDGLDLDSSRILTDMLTAFAVSGKTVLFASHMLDIVKRLSNQICVLKNGSKVFDEHVDDVPSVVPSFEESIRSVIGIADEKNDH